MSITVGLIAGEASGDALGAGLIRALRRRYPDARFVGVTGPKMQAAGCESWFDADALAVMGLVEVLRHLPRLLRLRRRLTRQLLALRPDVLIGIDAPDFTLGVEQRLRMAGIPTVHYVSPSIWAWRPGRIRKIEQAADLVLCLLPFEPGCYESARCAAQFVGHPLADELAPVADRPRLQLDNGLDPERPTLALLPGSRGGEVARHAALFLQTAQQVARRLDGLQVVLPAASMKRRDQLAAAIRQHGLGLDVRLSLGDAHEQLSCADVALVASGTATLETMLLGTPMVVAYRVSPLTAWMFRRFGGLSTAFFSLPNLVAGRSIVPECLQEAANADGLAQAVMTAFDPGHADAQRLAFAQQRSVLKQDASERAASAIAGLLHARSGGV